MIVFAVFQNLAEIIPVIAAAKVRQQPRTFLGVDVQISGAYHSLKNVDSTSFTILLSLFQFESG